MKLTIIGGNQIDTHNLSDEDIRMVKMGALMSDGNGLAHILRTMSAELSKYRDLVEALTDDIRQSRGQIQSAYDYLGQRVVAAEQLLDKNTPDDIKSATFPIGYKFIYKGNVATVQSPPDDENCYTVSYYDPDIDFVWCSPFISGYEIARCESVED